MICWVKRAGVIALAGVGLLVVGVLALGIGASTIAALWTERWQVVLAAAVLGGLTLIVWLRRR